MTESLFEQCGYIATFLGTLLEGEISLLTSVLGAKMGYYDFGLAMIAAFLGAWVADWFKFLVGKTKGKQLLERKPKIQAKLDKATVWFEKYPFTILTIYKFLFGFTTVILVMSGLKNIPYWRFALHTGISVGLWMIVLGGLGFHCAEAIMANIKFVSMYKLETIAVLALLAFLYWFLVKRPKTKYCLEPSQDM